jgi:hypothetical protein
MTHDHEAVELAIASLDFELTLDERTRMEAGLAACAECQAIAASHLDVQRRLERLPVHDASPLVRQRVLRASLVPPRTRQWQILLVAAALFGLLLAGAVAAGAFRTDPLDPITDVPPASPPALGDVVSPEPSQDASASPPSSDGGGGGSVFGTPLEIDSIAHVVSGRLRIRSQPRVADDSAKYEPLLDVGARLMVLDGPVVADDYEWYHVTAWDPKDAGRSWPVGWVARGDHDGTPWIDALPDVCPQGVPSITTVLSLAPVERVACFGDRELELRAYVAGSDETYACDSDPGCVVDGPTWLSVLGGTYAEVDAQSGRPSASVLLIAIDPSGRVPETSIPRGSMADLVGRFDHPAAADCRARDGLAAGRTTDEAARLECRARFVLTSVRADPAYPVAGAAGITVSDRLRVRSAPGLESRQYELLTKGTPVWVVEGPVIAADYEWFKVVVPGLEVEGAPRVGWVAESNHGHERWLASHAVQCPAEDGLTVGALRRLERQAGTHGGFACFADASLQFRGEVEVSCGESHPTWQVDPEWLGPNAFYTLSISNGTTVISAHMRPDLGVPETCGGGLELGMRTIRAHFGDGDAEACTGPPPSGIAAGDAEALIAYWCRTALVVDAIDPMPGVIGP